MSSFYDDFNDICRDADRELRAAFEDARSGSPITRGDWRLLVRSAADRLLAVNAFSRVCVGRALFAEIDGVLCDEHGEHQSPMYKVTLIPKKGMTTTDTRGFDLTSIKMRLRADLGGISYMGAIEPAYYASLPKNKGQERKAICWHVHLVVWGLSVEELNEFVGKLRKNKAYRPVVREFASINVAAIANGELRDVFAYIVKPPIHAYRVTRYPHYDTEGKIRTRRNGTRRFFSQQKASKLRESERVTLFHATKHLGLDELMVAGGRGSDLRKQVLRRAARDLNPRRLGGS